MEMINTIKTFISSVNMNNIRAALYAWLFNFFFSLIAYYGFYRVFSSAAGDSLLAGEAGSRYGVFNFLIDTFYNYKGSLPLIFSLLFLLTLLFALVSVFLAGGIYSVLIEERKAGFSNLLYASAESFFSMVKLLLVNILNWAIALIIPVFSMVLFWQPGILKVNETVVPVFFFAWVTVSAVILIFSTAIYDFSRISRLQEDKNFLYAFKKGIIFTFTNKLNVLLLFLLYGAVLLILFLVYSAVSGLLTNAADTIFIFILFQIFMFLRYYLKIVLMHAEVKIAEDRFEEE
ncbi:MAG: hypothetical protein KAT34_13290 [Candidatus Aminicenantes bacterium]|nr:hypothetical protein [Candidatus Aminicenantes bacterium]